MLEYIQSPEFRQLLTDYPNLPLYLFMVLGLFCVTLIACIGSIPRRQQITYQDTPLRHLKPGHYYVDRDRSVYEVPATEQDKSPRLAFGSSRKRKNRSKLSNDRRFRILRRDGFRCQICGVKATDDNDVTLHVDHRMPLAAGGTDDDANLWTLCDTCNLGKSDLIVPELLPKPSENGDNPEN